jgi:hypothetical protein
LRIGICLVGENPTSPAGEVAGNEDVFLVSACIAITGLHGAQFDKSQNREIKA